MVQIDASRGKGGGQIVRTAFSLSLMTCQAVTNHQQTAEVRLCVHTYLGW